MVAWTPDASPVKLRMLCASSRRTLREEFPHLILKEYNASERQEVSLAQYLEFTRGKTDQDRHDAMTQDEIEQEEVRKQVAKEQAAAPKMLPGLVALQVKLMDSFVESMKQFVEKSEGFAVLAKLENEEIAGELLEAEKVSALKGRLPSQPCFVALPAPGGAEGKLLFITWLPEGANPRQKMKISAFKESVREHIRSFTDLEIVAAVAADDDDLADDLGAEAPAAVPQPQPVSPARPKLPGAVALPGMGVALPKAPPREGYEPKSSSPLFQAQETAAEPVFAKSAAPAVIPLPAELLKPLGPDSVPTLPPSVPMPQATASPPTSPVAEISEFLSLAELQDAAVWKDRNVVATERERYLPEDVFKSLFGMDKEAFAKLPKWKKDNKKKAVRLI
ncbi:unnamed protein product [Effrenium voratum]|nr:unnamed protein product [Effrenium voratum]